MLRVAEEGDESIHVNCRATCLASPINAQGLWLSLLSDKEGHIFFFDEDNVFIYSKEFASLVKKSNNYFVFVTRRELLSLAYSVNDIYELKTSGKYNYFEHAYNFLTLSNFTPDMILTEDSNSGYVFFKSLCDLSKSSCFSANGNSNVFKVLEKLLYGESGKILVVVDGASFGAFMNKIEGVVRTLFSERVALHLPESFEYMLLSSRIFRKYFKKQKIIVTLVIQVGKIIFWDY